MYQVLLFKSRRHLCKGSILKSLDPLEFDLMPEKLINILDGGTLILMSLSLI